MNSEHLTITADCEPGARIDKYLSGLEQSRSALEKLFDAGKISVNGKACKKNRRLNPGDRIDIALAPPEVEIIPEPQYIPLDILYEDKHIIVVNKPKAMAVHPSPNEAGGTLVNGLLYHCKGRLSAAGESFRPGIVHRIDKDTSGILVCAKTDIAHLGLAKQVMEHSMRRVYTGVVTGRLEPDEGVVDAPIARHPLRRTMYCVPDTGGRQAVTKYKALERYWGLGYTHAEFTLVTGRTHQIRVHMAYLGHPLAGDGVYGHDKGLTKRLKGQCLHAGTLGFVHPVSGVGRMFHAEPPKIYMDFLEFLSMGENS